MADRFRSATFDLFGGLNTLDNEGDIFQDDRKQSSKNPIRMVQANNIYAPDERFDMSTIPGFAEVRATAINAAAIGTGMIHQGEIADNFLIAASILGSKHSIYQDSANPPAELATGTNFTIGQDNLISSANFTDGSAAGTIFVSRSKDLPQFVNASPTRSDFTIAGTGLTSLKPEIIEIFGQRALYGDYDEDGTVHDDRVAFSKIRDGNNIVDIETNFYSFETPDKDRVRALKRFSDVCLVGKLSNVFLLAVSPSSVSPFAIRELPSGKDRGPVSQHGVIEADERLFWMGQTNIHSLGFDGRVRDLADVISPTIAGLNDSRRQFTVAGVDPSNHLIHFSVSDGSDTTHQTIIGLNYKTGALYVWTRARNAFANRLVSGEERLIGMGYVGKFYQEFTGTTGNLDDATAVIDADVFTPRHHMGSPDIIKIFGEVYVTFDQQSAEAVTVQYRLNDASSWTSFSASPYSVGGTAGHIDIKRFPLMKAGTHLQLRFRDNNSGEAYRVQRYTITFKPWMRKI